MWLLREARAVSGFRITEWNGPALERKVQKASMEAIDEITQQAADDAKGSHWWSNRTGNLESQIVNEPAEASGSGISGKFGATQIQGFYGLFLEHRGPFLRPAADRNFPKLAAAIKKRMG